MLCEIDTDIVKQLVEIYFREEYWQENKMPEDIAYNYHKKLYEQGNIQVFEKDGLVLGYYEVWRINFEQFGRIICHIPFYADSEDVVNGNIAFVANTWIKSEYRNSYVYKVLRNLFFKHNFKCDYYCGEALRKKTQPVKVFKKSELLSKLFKEGAVKDGFI